MKKLFNIGLVLCALFCILLVGASFALKAYLSDARLKGMIVPPMEKALGRTVEIGQINVSLFSGVQVYDFAIKEANGADDFISSSRFVVYYNVLPLIQGKFVISEIRFVDPSIHVYRDADGVFNFQSLVVLSKKKRLEEKGGESQKVLVADQGVLPFSVEIENFVIENGMVSVRDEQGMLPETDVITNSEIHLGIGHNVTDYHYNGEIRFVVDTLYKGVEFHKEGRVDFDENRCEFTADILIDRQALQVTGSVEDYKASGLPPLIFNLYSEELDVDQLVQSLTNLSEKAEGEEVATTKTVTGKSDGVGIPADLNVHGEILFNKVNVAGLLLEDLKFQYGLEKAVFTIVDLKGRTLGGEIRGEVTADLNSEPSYGGKLAGHEFQLGAIGQTYFNQSAATMAGSVSGAVSFTGQGTDPEVIKKRLSATGEYTIHDGMISGSTLTQSLASALNLRELKDLPIKKMAGRFEIDRGKIRFTSSTDSAYFKGKSVGSIGLNGTLDIPVTMSLSPRLSQQLDRRLEAAQYMERQNGRTIVHFMVDGSISKPKVSLDVAKSGKNAASQAIDNLTQEGSEEEKAAGEAVKSVLDELFGQ